MTTLPFVRSEEDEFELADPEGYRLLEAISKELNSSEPLAGTIQTFLDGLLADLDRALQDAGQARHNEADAALRDYRPGAGQGALALLVASSIERMAKQTAQDLRDIAAQGPLSKFAIENQPSQPIFQKAIDPGEAKALLEALKAADFSAEPASVQSAVNTLIGTLETMVGGYQAPAAPYTKGVVPRATECDEAENAALVQGVADKYRRAHKDIVNLT